MTANLVTMGPDSTNFKGDYWFRQYRTTGDVTFQEITVPRSEIRKGDLVNGDIEYVGWVHVGRVHTAPQQFRNFRAGYGIMNPKDDSDFRDMTRIDYGGLSYTVRPADEMVTIRRVAPEQTSTVTQDETLVTTSPSIGTKRLDRMPPAAMRFWLTALADRPMPQEDRRTLSTAALILGSTPEGFGQHLNGGQVQEVASGVSKSILDHLLDWRSSGHLSDLDVNRLLDASELLHGIARRGLSPATPHLRAVR